GPLAAPDRAVARLLDGRARKFGILGLELLQADDVGLRRRQPVEQVGKPLVDVVDVEGRDFHPVRLRGEGPARALLGTIIGPELAGSGRAPSNLWAFIRAEIRPPRPGGSSQAAARCRRRRAPPRS